ncbi:uncharacterized protein GGS25DRAFT_493469 [Hypoxylon fragiforme]|uniref:uncharacterized protein n=1 Tax=Hypoxylon fragiforme TaxID=63214 RepID=UPI0020C6FABC|nr:uncharacterized protein GGS25DRAFT_493469 [Hypoxylon fragiforme]KAI2606852.1 hypothetical protein GGS25DRAFT_493469 [Hypoxylon fragiforme]
MQQELSEVLNQIRTDNTFQTPNSLRQHGLQHHDPSGSADQFLLRQPSGDGATHSAQSDGRAGFLDKGINANTLQEQLRRLSVGDEESSDTRAKPPGQRISEYENALTPAVPRQPLGFKVIKRAGAESSGRQLSDFPNEILTHILSHLHPDSHASVALVSKRFYSLVTTPHAWRMAFQRFFPGHNALTTAGKQQSGLWGQDDTDIVCSGVRYFTRLTPQASWRSEYLLRTRLLRSLARGKPGTNFGGIGSSSRASQSGKKASAVLTYNTKLLSPVTSIHAIFKPSGKKPPRVIHGASDKGVASASDPTTGKVEKWGLDDHFGFAQLNEVVPHIIPYGVGEGPAAVPNVIDVSQPYGLVGGEGFPGGRVFYRATNEYRGRYLGQNTRLVGDHPDIPKIPGISEGICSVWIAKTSTVPSMTQSLLGILTGSSLGVVTAYALGYDPSGPRYATGEMSARWILSPGVPIIALKVDDSYSQKRKALGRVCVVALNALGEVFYMAQPPTAPTNKVKPDDSIKLAWHTGRSTCWHLIEVTRRQARLDESGGDAIRGAYSPRSPSNSMGLTRDQMVAEAREIEKFLNYKPSHFREVCHGWDMRRRLEVDFASDDNHGAGENVFIIDCGLEKDQTSAIRRFHRNIANPSQFGTQTSPSSEFPEDMEVAVSSLSIFGTGGTSSASPISLDKLSSSNIANIAMSDSDNWVEMSLYSKELASSQITATNMDASQLALITTFEDPLRDVTSSTSNGAATPTNQSPSDIPGRRARLLGVGTDKGKIILWNAREAHTSDRIQPVRNIQTESPKISCLALSALYLIHGGSDGLVQAWDPLASTLDPIRTINSQSPGRMPRRFFTAYPSLRSSDFSAVRAIYLDPDPTVLHGIVSFGTVVRYWAYSSSNHATGRKRRKRHSDIHGRATGRRHHRRDEGYIAAEAEEFRNEQHYQAQQRARLQARFGVGLGDLTEEEALHYAEMMSQESFLHDEHRRTSTSDPGSAVDFDMSSNSGSTVTPDASVTGPSLLATSSSAHNNATDESDYELQIQAAIRLSLLESADDSARSPRTSSSDDYDGSVTISEGIKEKAYSSTSLSPSHTPMVKPAELSGPVATGSQSVTDDDLEFALQLSLAEEESRKASLATLEEREDEFPALGGSGIGKGKGRAI